MAAPPRLLPAMAAAALPLSCPTQIPELFCRSIGSSWRSSVILGARVGSDFGFSSKFSICRKKVSLRHRDSVGSIRCSQPKVESELDYETCELVNGTEIIIGEGEGENSIRAYLMKAVKNNNGNGVLLLSDVLGFEDSSTRDFAYRVACSGYNVLVPDLFRGNPWKGDQPNADFGSWVVAHPSERISSDIAQSSQWLEEELIAAGLSKKLGIIGFSFGAHHLIETLARDKLGRFGTGICFYGTDMDPAQAQSIGVPVLFICGDNDTHCPLNMIRDMEKQIHGAKVLVYGGRGHGFAHRPESQEEDDDAEDAFATARTWLHDFLVAEMEQNTYQRCTRVGELENSTQL